MFDPAKYLPNPHDALQEPSHRWLRCRYLLEHSRSPSTQDDAVTREAWRFLHELRECGNDAGREQLARTSPALAEARGFSQNAALLQRAELEARLLAGECEESIAPKCNLSPGAVHLFHALFFEVRSYLQAEVYILNVAIGPKVHHGLRSDDHDVLLKLAGYTMGSVAVDQLLAYYADPPFWPVSLAHLDDTALETLRDKLWIRAWILSLTMPANATTSARLPAIQRLLAQARALRRATADHRNSPSAALDTGLDWHDYLTTPTLMAPDAYAAASQGTALDLPHRISSLASHLTERKAVSA